MKKDKTNWVLTAVLIIIAAVAIIFPLYIAVLIALKIPKDMVPSPLSFPKVLHFENFLKQLK